MVLPLAGPCTILVDLLQNNHEYGEIDTAIVTLPTAISSLQLYYQMPYSQWSGPGPEPSNATATMQSPQPMVLASCTPEPQFLEDQGVYYITSNGSQRPLDKARSLYETLVLGNETIETTNRSSLPPLWISSPDDPQLLLGIYARPDCKVTNNCVSPPRGNVYICSVSAFWRTAATSSTPDSESCLTEVKPPDYLSIMSAENLRPITINPEGNTALSAPCLRRNDNDRVEGSDIATCFAVALSDLPGSSKYENGMSWYDAEYVEALSRAELHGSSSYTSFQVDLIRYGYGYASSDTATRLALAVITAYCLFAMIYICYIIATGHTSLAWNSATELIMLALQSKEPDHLGHISVGLDSMETFRQGVGIRVSTSDDVGEVKEKLELVFKHGGEDNDRGLKKVVRNRAY